MSSVPCDRRRFKSVLLEFEEGPLDKILAERRKILSEIAGTPVSRETVEKLFAYEALLQKWQKTINLVGRGTLQDAWRRHFLDSAQLAPLVPVEARSVADMGSGAGFPGLVLSVLWGSGPSLPEVSLFESDERKCVFLRLAAQEAGAFIDIQNTRLEETEIGPFDCLVSRALAPVARLFELGAPLSHGRTRMIFLKGKQWKDEVEEAREEWTFDMETVDSVTDSFGQILIFENVDAVK